MRRVSKREIEIGMRLQPIAHEKRLTRKQKFEAEQKVLFSAIKDNLRVGQIVRAKVIRRSRSKGLVQLENGMHAHLGDCLNHDDGCPVNWLELPGEGLWIDAYVRAIRPEYAMVLVSMHTYSRDMRYLLFNSGYRSSYDGTTAPFAQLPWEKPRTEKKKLPIW